MRVGVFLLKCIILLLVSKFLDSYSDFHKALPSCHKIIPQNIPKQQYALIPKNNLIDAANIYRYLSLTVSMSTILLLNSKTANADMSKNTNFLDIGNVRKNERIYDTRRKSYLPSHPEKYIHDEIKHKRVITIGEVHSNSQHHLLEFRILTTLAGFIGTKNLAIGLECFYRQHQAALDNFIFKHGSMKILKNETNWQETWGYDLSQYAKIFNFAYLNKIRLVGLNIPHQIVSFVAQNGFNELPLKIKEKLPDIDLTNVAHREQFQAAIFGMSKSEQSKHGSINKKVFDHMYESQTLFDEYMAESACNFISSSNNKQLVLLIIAGYGHIKGRNGIPLRIEKRIKQNPFVIVPYEVDWLEDGLPDIDTPPNIDECDWAWYTE